VPSARGRVPSGNPGFDLNWGESSWKRASHGANDSTCQFARLARGILETMEKRQLRRELVLVKRARRAKANMAACSLRWSACSQLACCGIARGSVHGSRSAVQAAGTGSQSANTKCMAPEKCRQIPTCGVGEKWSGRVAPGPGESQRLSGSWPCGRARQLNDRIQRALNHWTFASSGRSSVLLLITTCRVLRGVIGDFAWKLLLAAFCLSSSPLTAVKGELCAQ
jgi:hypothetical protein